MRSATAIALAVSLCGLAVVATTGCIWLLFDRPQALPPCHDLWMVDNAPPYRPADEVIWRWLKRHRIDDAGPVYVTFDGDMDKVNDELHRYQLPHPGAAPIDYFASLGMSCQPGAHGPFCERELTVRYVCIPTPRVRGADIDLPQYEALLTVAARFDAQGSPRIGGGMVGKGGPLWPPGRPPIAKPPRRS